MAEAVSAVKSRGSGLAHLSDCPDILLLLSEVCWQRTPSSYSVCTPCQDSSRPSRARLYITFFDLIVSIIGSLDMPGLHHDLGGRTIDILFEARPRHVGGVVAAEMCLCVRQRMMYSNSCRRD